MTKIYISPIDVIQDIPIKRMSAELVRAARHAIRERMTCPRCGWPSSEVGQILEFHFDRGTDGWVTSVQPCHHDQLVGLWQQLETTSIWD